MTRLQFPGTPGMNGGPGTADRNVPGCTLRRRYLRLAAMVLTVLAAAACTAGPDGAGGLSTDESSAGAATAETIATGLDAPWSVAFAGSTALISERDTGRILSVNPDGTTYEVGSIAESAGSGEGGLLGIAVQDGVLFTYLTAGEENRIDRRELSGDAGSWGMGPPETVVEGIPAGRVHNGGRLAFGPDGMLYATTGDAGDRDSAQDLESLAGKILRMAADGTVPADNPLPGSLVYSYGHRNPQGIGWDADGILYASEFGQDTWDELNVIEPGGNYGWPEVEGMAGEAGFIDPVQQWAPDVASPSGIAVVKESAYIANLRGERLRQVPLAGPGTSTDYFTGEHGRLRDVVNAPDGSLWVLTNNTDGRGKPGPDDDRILRMEPPD